jgi:hypothetical protein
MTFGINDIQRNDTIECRDYIKVMLSVVMLNGVMLTVVVAQSMGPML